MIAVFAWGQRGWFFGGVAVLLVGLGFIIDELRGSGKPDRSWITFVAVVSPLVATPLIITSFITNNGRYNNIDIANQIEEYKYVREVKKIDLQHRTIEYLTTDSQRCTAGMTKINSRWFIIKGSPECNDVPQPIPLDERPE